MAGEITFEWDDPRAVGIAVRKLLARRRDGIKEIPASAVREGTFKMLELIQQEIKALRRSSTNSSVPTMIRSLTIQVQRSGEVTEGKVGTFLKLLLYLERGTGLHGPKRQAFTIEARRKQALFWGAFDGDNPIIRRRVIHPGMKPRQPFGKAVVKLLPIFRDIILRRLAKEARA